MPIPMTLAIPAERRTERRRMLSPSQSRWGQWPNAHNEGNPLELGG